jgi:hypothetical protein
MQHHPLGEDQPGLARIKIAGPEVGTPGANVVWDILGLGMTIKGMPNAANSDGAVPSTP